MAQELNEIIVSDNSDSMDDPERKELLWEEREEKVIEAWQEHCRVASKAHGRKARVMKKRYTCVTLPSILIPVAISGFSTMLTERPLATSGLMVIVSFFSGISGFLNLGQLTEKHFQFQALYADLALDIETEMCRPKRMRGPCDVFLEHVRSQLSKLDLSAPNL